MAGALARQQQGLGPGLGRGRHTLPPGKPWQRDTWPIYAAWPLRMEVQRRHSRVPGAARGDAVPRPTQVHTSHPSHVPSQRWPSQPRKRTPPGGFQGGENPPFPDASPLLSQGNTAHQVEAEQQGPGKFRRGGLSQPRSPSPTRRKGPQQSPLLSQEPPAAHSSVPSLVRLRARKSAHLQGCAFLPGGFPGCPVTGCGLRSRPRPKPESYLLHPTATPGSP